MVKRTLEYLPLMTVRCSGQPTRHRVIHLMCCCEIRHTLGV
jgi:hypothetical protein